MRGLQREVLMEPDAIRQLLLDDVLLPQPEMYSDAGNRALKEATAALVERMESGDVARIDLDDAAEQVIADVAEDHPEAYDTEPRAYVTQVVNATCQRLAIEPIEWL